MRVPSMVALAVLLLSGCTGLPVEDVRDAAALEARIATPPVLPPVEENETENVTELPELVAILEASAVNGSAPLAVNFTLNATGLVDAPLVWTLVIDLANITAAGNDTVADNATGGNFTRAEYHGSELPFMVQFNFTDAGMFNVTLTVFQGPLNASAAVALEILGGNISAPLPPEPLVLKGTPKIHCPQCSEAGANTGVGYRAGVNELDSWFVAIPASAAGLPFTLTSASQLKDPELSFRTSCASTGTAVAGFNAVGPEQGIVPEGALCALVWEYAGPTALITLTIG